MEGQLESLTKQFSDFIKAQDQRDKVLFEKLDRQSRPNYMLIVTLIGVLVVFYFAERDSIVKPLEQSIANLALGHDQLETRTVKAFDKLDEKLQIEARLLKADTESRVDAVNTTSHERDTAQSLLIEQARVRIDKLEDSRLAFYTNEEQELRRWRNGELKRP